MIERHWPGQVITGLSCGKQVVLLSKATVARACGCATDIGFTLPLPGELTLTATPCSDEHEQAMLEFLAAHQRSHEDRPELAERDAAEVAELLMDEAFQTNAERT